jgi:CheY-like chemotaxis protein
MAKRGDVEKDRVLVVEDNAAARAETVALLTKEGYEVLSASDIDTALETVEDRKPQAVLFSILNPPAGAIDFARRLALSSSNKFVPVVMVTALNEYQLGSFLNGVPGVRRFVYSPCASDALRAEVANAVRHARR